LEVGIGLALAALTVYLSTLTFALRAYSRSQLAKRLGEPRARWLQRLDDNESELQAVTGFARMMAIVATALWFFGGLHPLNAAEWRATVAPGILTVLFLMFGAVGVPHAIAWHNADAVVASNLPMIWGLRCALLPVERAMVFVEFIVRRLMGKSELSAADETERVEQEILDAVEEGEAHGAVDEEKREMIQSIFELSETPVSAIMTPRTDMVAVSLNSSFDEARETIVRAGHTRVPVYQDSRDHIVGVLYAKDLLQAPSGEGFEVQKVMRAAQYVPESKPIDQLLRDLRQARVHIAIVLDEYGGTAGLVTIEDILEELVGEIDDEYDRGEAPFIRKVDEDTVEADARVHVYEINEQLAIHLPEDGDYETIGGFVFSAMGKIPAAGDELTHENVHIAILAAEPRRINRVRVHVERQAVSA